MRAKPATGHWQPATDCSDRLGYDGAGRNITKRYLAGGINGSTYGYNNTSAVVGQTTAYDHGGNKFFERALQAETRSNLYQPVDNSGNIASPLPGYDSVNRLLQYQRGELSTTGGYQNNGGGSVTTGIGLNNTDSQRSYSLDGLGNWKKSVYLPEGSTTSETDQRNNNYVNQTTQRSVAGGVAVTFEYDGHATPSPGNGNLTNGGTLIYQYDALNRLVAVNRVSDGLAIAAYVYDAMNRRVRKTINNGGITGDVPNGTTDCCWMGWRCMEERNPFGGSGSTDTPTKQYVWGTYLDECIQLNLLQPAGPQNLPAGSYYLLQDTLYRAVALTNSSGNIVEAYDTDAYGNTLIFTGPGPDNTWFTDDDLQSSYGANDIIYCGYRYDAETQNYYVRNRYYLPTLGRWLTRDPIGYQGGINLYEYVQSNPVGNVDAEGMQVYMYGVGISNTPTATPPPPAPGVYVYNVATLGGLGFHQVVAVVGPNGTLDAVSFAPDEWALIGRGVVYPDNGGDHWETYETFKFEPGLAAQASAYLKNYLNSLIGKKGNYNVFTNNCRDFSQGQFNRLKAMYDQFLAHALNSAQQQILAPSIPAFPNPGNPVLSVGSA